MNKKLIKYFIIGLTGFATTLFIVFILQGKALFTPGNLAFQMFIFSLFTAIAYPIFSVLNFKWSLILFLFFLIMVAFFEMFSSDHLIFTSTTFYFSYGCFLYIYSYIIQNGKINKTIFRLFTLATFYAIANLSFVLLSMLFVKLGNPLPMIFFQMIIGFVLGFCLGLGFEIGRIIFQKFFENYDKPLI